MKKLIDEIKNKTFEVEEKYSHITPEIYSKLSVKEQKEVPLNNLKQIDRRGFARKVLFYNRTFNFTKHISILFLLCTIFAFFNFLIIIPIITLSLGIISTIICYFQYSNLDANLFAYVAMNKFFEQCLPDEKPN